MLTLGCQTSLSQVWRAYDRKPLKRGTLAILPNIEIKEKIMGNSNRAVIVLSVCLFVICGCVPPTGILSHSAYEVSIGTRDVVEGTLVIKERKNAVKVLKHPKLQAVQLDLCLTYDKNDSLIDSKVYANYVAETWMFIPAGETLFIVVDGEKMSFSSPFESFRSVHSGKIVEFIGYDISRVQVEKVVAGTIVQGKLRFVEFEFSDINKQRWSKILTENWKN